jgi:hypothetical protein
MQHLHYTLDPIEAEKDGTLASLKKLLGKEAKTTAKDKLILDRDIANLEGEHEEDTEYIEKQAKAGWLLDYFHQKIADSDEGESDFDIRNVSDVSDDKLQHQKNPKTRPPPP